MRRVLVVAIVVGLLTLGMVAVAPASIALNSSRSNIYRVQGAAVLTATRALSGPRQTLTVYTTPDEGELVLTQFCASPATGGIRLAVEGLGSIAQTGSALCYTFAPGVSVPKSADITCATTASAPAGDYFCTVSGLLAQ